MELLIKVGSNIDPRVRCLNCLHEFIDESNIITQCPKCHSAYLDKRQNNCWQDGDIIEARPDGWWWSPCERLHVVKMSAAEAQKLLNATTAKSEQELCELLARNEYEEVEVNDTLLDIILKRRQYCITETSENVKGKYKSIKESDVEKKTAVTP